jgi:bifunctional non-homologous end joining protein LigD
MRANVGRYGGATIEAGPDTASISLMGRVRPRQPGGERLTIAGVSISHPERVFFPADGITKVDVARYYEAVADWIVPHVQGRPLTLVRCAESIEDCVYMRHLKVWRHWPALRVLHIPEQRKLGEYLVADDTPGLVSLAQMDILELHTWNVTAPHLEHPDRIVIDLDPGPGVTWRAVADTAQLVRQALLRYDLRSWVKTTGGLGLHVVAPLDASAAWDACLTFTRQLAHELERARPALLTSKLAKAARVGKIFIDYLRNNRGNSSVAAYSVRARPGAPVSVPLAWAELGGERPHFTLRTLPARLARLGRRDPWAAYFRRRQALPAS